MLRATPSMRPISRALTPSRTSRNVCLICLMVSPLFAGINLLLVDDHEALMTELLTERKT